MSGPDPSAYTDNSAFVRLLETEGRVRILDVLLRRPHATLTAGEISELAGFDTSTFSRNKGELESLDIVEKDFDGGQAVYSLNVDNEIVQVLGEAHTELARFDPKVVDQMDDHDNDLGEILSQIDVPESDTETLSETDAALARELSNGPAGVDV